MSDIFSTTYGPRVEEFFTTNRIFLKHAFKVAGAYKPGDPMKIPRDLSVERYATMPPRGLIAAGAYSYCMAKSIGGPLRLGRYCSIATNVRIMGIEHPTDWFTTHVGAFRWYGARFAKEEFGKALTLPPFEPSRGDVVVGNDVWIGQDVLLKPGIRIGDGAIIAAGAVVTKDVPPYHIMGGVPARRIRLRFPETTVERLLALQWWNYNFADFGGLSFDRIDDFIDGLEHLILDGAIQAFNPGHVMLANELEAFLAMPDKKDAPE